MSFSDFQLHPKLNQAVEAEGYTEATPIQKLAIPLVRDGYDVIGCAQTGTGKTAAFALPTLDRLVRAKERGEDKSSSASRSRTPAVKVLVLVPTRELASQVSASFAKYGRFSGMRTLMVYGGVSPRPQITALRRGIDILIATPGRLLDLVRQHAVRLDEVRTLILDEADQMLDMGFIDDLRRIVSFIPQQRQTLMFSATMPDPIRKLTTEWLRDPRSIAVPQESKTPVRLQQAVYYVEQRLKPNALVQLLRNQPKGSRTLVFCRTKRGVDKVIKHLDGANISAIAIHGNKTQNARQNALRDFRSGYISVMVATDIASRGLHIDDVSTVVNYELPDTPESYIHRIGRTARANASGSSLTFCAPEERYKLRQIERLTRQPVLEVRLPGDDDEGVVAEAAPVRERPATDRRPQNAGGAPRKPAGTNKRFAKPNKWKPRGKGPSNKVLATTAGA